MYFRMRRKNGEEDPLSSGALIAQDGTSHHVTQADVRLASISKWKSPKGYHYPSGWTLWVQPLGRELMIQPVLADQEFRHDATYWEGAVDVKDPQSGQPLGRGYVELTGYAPDATKKTPE